MQRTFEKEIFDLETRFWKSMKDKDIDAALQLTDNPCIVTGAQGVARTDKQTFAKEWPLDMRTPHGICYRRLVWTRPPSFNIRSGQGEERASTPRTLCRTIA